MQLFYFRQCISCEAKRKEGGNLTESVFVALNSYHYMLHTALDTLVKGTYH